MNMSEKISVSQPARRSEKNIQPDFLAYINSFESEAHSCRREFQQSLFGRSAKTKS